MRPTTQAVAALLQRDTSAIVTLKSLGIDRPAKVRCERGTPWTLKGEDNTGAWGLTNLPGWAVASWAPAHTLTYPHTHGRTHTPTHSRTRTHCGAAGGRAVLLVRKKILCITT